MDPNANLREQEGSLTADRLRELRQALYQWLAAGGFPPDWTTYPLGTFDFEDWCDAKALPITWPRHTLESIGATKRRRPRRP